MDARAANGNMNKWNVCYRRSTNGGCTWSSEVDLSMYVAGSTYIFSNYYEMDIDEQGTAHLIWGESFSYDSPGSIWYAKGQ